MFFFPSVFYETFVSEDAKRLWDRFEFVFTPKHGELVIEKERDFAGTRSKIKFQLNRHLFLFFRIQIRQRNAE
jgi:hypothetical protein